MTNSDVVKKLIGPVSPVGETNRDKIRFDNLQELTHLIESLLMDVDDLATYYMGRKEYSINMATDFAKAFMKRIVTDFADYKNISV